MPSKRSNFSHVVTLHSPLTSQKKIIPSSSPITHICVLNVTCKHICDIIMRAFNKIASVKKSVTSLTSKRNQHPMLAIYPSLEAVKTQQTAAFRLEKPCCMMRDPIHSANPCKHSPIILASHCQPPTSTQPISTDTPT